MNKLMEKGDGRNLQDTAQFQRHMILQFSKNKFVLMSLKCVKTIVLRKRRFFNG